MRAKKQRSSSNANLLERYQRIYIKLLDANLKYWMQLRYYKIYEYHHPIISRNYRVTEKVNIVSVLTFGGASALNGMKEMLIM